MTRPGPRKSDRLAEALAAGKLVPASKLLPPVGRAERLGRTAPAPLERVCPGREIQVATPTGAVPCHLVGRPTNAPTGREAAVRREYATVLRGARQRFDELEASSGLCHAASARPGDLLFVRPVCGRGRDAAIFLMGLMFHEDDRLVCRQYLARHEGEEVALLQAFADLRDSFSLLVTYDGRPGDLKRIARGCEIHDIPPPDRGPPHLDLRAEVRKQWRNGLPSFSLTAVQSRLLGRRPTRSASPAEMSRAHLALSATGHAEPIKPVLARNRDDLLSMAQILCLLLTGTDPLA